MRERAQAVRARQLPLLWLQGAGWSGRLQLRLREQVSWRNARAEPVADHVVWVSAEGTAAEAVLELRPLLDPAQRDQPIRCMEVSNHRICRVRRDVAACTGPSLGRVQQQLARMLHPVQKDQPTCCMEVSNHCICQARLSPPPAPSCR